VVGRRRVPDVYQIRWIIAEESGEERPEIPEFIGNLQQIEGPKSRVKRVLYR